MAPRRTILPSIPIPIKIWADLNVEEVTLYDFHMWLYRFHLGLLNAHSWGNQPVCNSFNYPEATVRWRNLPNRIEGLCGEKRHAGWSTAAPAVPGEVSDMDIRKPPGMSSLAEPSSISSPSDYLSVITWQPPSGHCLEEPIQPTEPWERLYMCFKSVHFGVVAVVVFLSF